MTVARPLAALAVAAGLGCAEGGPERDAGPRVVRIHSQPARLSFDPAEIRLDSPRTVRFLLADPYPESVAFDTTGLQPAAAAFVREAELDRGPLLTTAGQSYDLSFEGAPSGAYPYRSVANAAEGMRGVVIVE